MSHLLFLDYTLNYFKCYVYCLPLVPAPDVSLNNISVIAGNTATFTCTITASNLVDNNDLNGLSLANTTFRPSSGTMNTPSRNNRVFTVKYTISNVNTGNAGVYSCQTMVQHSDSNLLISSSDSGNGTLYVIREYI